MYNQTSLAHVIGHKNFEFVRADVRDLQSMKSIVSKSDIVLPLAAIVGAPACQKDPVAARSINNDSIKWLFDNLSREQRVIMPTTNSAYGQGGEMNHCDETSPLNPLSLYARDKVEIESELMKLPNAISFRLATVFGISPRMRLDLLVNNFVHRALTDRFLVVFEGSFKRNYIHLDDVVQAFNLAIDNFDSLNGEIYNVGLSSANISKLELCAKIKEYLPDFVFFESQFGKDPDQRNYIVSNKKIEARGFSAKISLDDGIRELIKGLPLFSQNHFTNL
jgi:nucleoside-diphosphate-sugar epimerase